LVGVLSNKKQCQYIGQLRHNEKIYYCGTFSNKLETAQAVNWKCVQLNIPLKNPQAGLSENIPQVRFVKNLRQCYENKCSKI
jgi:hypothetical protein